MKNNKGYITTDLTKSEPTIEVTLDIDNVSEPVWCAVCRGDGMGRDAHGTLSEPCKYCEGKGWVNAR